MRGDILWCVGMYCDAWGYIVLCWDVLCGDVLWCVGMYCDAWGCTVMRGDILWCVGMYCDVWGCIVMHGDVLWCMGMYCDVWGCTVMHGDVLSCVVCSELCPRGAQWPAGLLPILPCNGEVRGKLAGECNRQEKLPGHCLSSSENAPTI